MRKIDYTLLAQIIRDELCRCKKLPSSTPQVELIERIARQFAAVASVDRLAFLRACGIEQ